MPRQEPSLIPESQRRRHLTQALLMLACVTFGGTAGFVIIEEWSFWRALFFTLITITTVGYGDEGISETGKKFATLLLVGGIGVASYTFALVVQTAVASQFAWRKGMQKRIDQLRQHAIVCGFGRMGRTLCARLRKLGVPFVVIERDQERFHQACDEGYPALEGSGSDDETLELAGIQRATHLVNLISSAAESIVVTLSARQLCSALTIITRAEREEDVRKLKLAGATRIISPYRSGGVEVANLITRPHVADFLARSSVDDSDVALADVEVAAGSTLVGRSLSDYGREEASRISFVALGREGEAVRIPPRGKEVLEAGDRLIIAGDPEQIARMREHGRAPTRAA